MFLFGCLKGWLLIIWFFFLGGGRGQLFERDTLVHLSSFQEVLSGSLQSHFFVNTHHFSFQGRFTKTPEWILFKICCFFNNEVPSYLRGITNKKAMHPKKKWVTLERWVVFCLGRLPPPSVSNVIVQFIFHIICCTCT